MKSVIEKINRNGKNSRGDKNQIWVGRRKKQWTWGYFFFQMTFKTCSIFFPTGWSQWLIPLILDSLQTVLYTHPAPNPILLSVLLPEWSLEKPKYDIGIALTNLGDHACVYRLNFLFLILAFSDLPILTPACHSTFRPFPYSAHTP